MDLFLFGCGYVARRLGRTVQARGGNVGGTSRSAETRERLRSWGWTMVDVADPRVADMLHGASHVLSSVPPGPDGDPVLERWGKEVGALGGERWWGYCSATSVYGQHHGGWVCEETPPMPVGERGRRRVAAETHWTRATAGTVRVFRLAGIYGPGRNAFLRLRDRGSSVLVNPGQIFSRIHRDDAARIILAAMDRADSSGVYNGADHLPTPPQDPVEFAAALMGCPKPERRLIRDAEISDIQRSFYGESKRVRGVRTRVGLGVRLGFPHYRHGLRALWRAGEDYWSDPDGSLPDDA